MPVEPPNLAQKPAPPHAQGEAEGTRGKRGSGRDGAGDPASEAHGHGVWHEVLPNGLTLLLREAHLAPVVDFQIWAQVGSADEGPGEGGLAHFHEHMLFKGTPTRGIGAIAGDVEGAGGRINAYTSFDATVYYATLPTDALATGIDVLCDAVCNSSFDADEVRREREVVLEEIRRADDTPAHVLSDATFGTVYSVHPYRSPILGPAETVAAFERDQVRQFFERWYAPNNLVVVAAGDFEAAAVAEQVRRAFGDAKPSDVRRGRPVEPAQTAMRTRLLRAGFEGARVDMAWRATRLADADTPLLDLLSFILGECDSSRLIEHVRDAEELVERIDSSAYTPLDPGIFSVDFETDPQRVTQAIERVVTEVERLRAQRVTGSELARARANFLASEHFEHESVSGLAGRLGSFHVLGGDHRGDVAYLERIRAATPADLQRVAQTYLAPEHLNVAALLADGDTPEVDESALRRAVTRGVDRTRRRFARPARSKEPREQVISYELDGGTALHVLPRPDVPVFAARAAVLGGLLCETMETAGISSFLSSMWTRGTQTRSAADFARAVEDIAAEVNGFSGRSSQGFSLEATSDQLEPTLDLFAEALLAPGFDDDEIERERRETLSVIERRGDRLAQLAYIRFGETHFPTHPYRIPMLGYEHTVKTFDAAALRAQHDRIMRADRLVVGIAGDVDPDGVAEAFAVRLADLPRDGAEIPMPTLDPAPAGIEVTTLAKDRSQAHIVLGFRGITVDDPDRAVVDVMSQVLAGQGGRIFLELRDRRGLAYSVNAMSVEGLAPGFFTVYIATSPDKVGEARQGILDELARLVETAPDAAELDRARRYLTGSLAIDAQRNSNHAAHITLDALYGLGPEAHAHYADQISAVTPEDVLRVARRILTLDAYTLSIVGGDAD